MNYDAIVIGAGAGGGVAAALLAEAGKTVLLIERGRSLSFEDIGRHPLKNQRVNAWGHNAGPGPDQPRVFVGADGEATTVRPWDGRYHANAATVGGGTRVYGGQAWRFHPLDFAMASTYGVPEGSSLSDWPLSYEDELGVAGDSAAMQHLPAYARDYPMPPHAPTRVGQLLRSAAGSLGWHTLPVPLSINTQPRDGREACTQCLWCVGFACQVDAKNGTQNTFIPRAVATGKCTLVTDAMVTRIEISGNRATGVTYLDEKRKRITVSADTVFVAAGAIETARLLMLSGVEHNELGRNLQGHVYVGAYGRFEDEVWDGLGPGVSTATTRWSHGNDGIVGGGMLADDFIMLPTAFWRTALPPTLPRWGEATRDWVAHNYRRVMNVKGPIQDIPSPDARVTLDPDVKDRFGLPVARLSGSTHPESIKTAAFLHAKAVEWVRAAGAVEVWGDPPGGPALSGSQHQAGTCRMGTTPTNSVVNADGRIHSLENVFVCDTSVHVTNGGFNPFLTAMALSYRTTERALRAW
jgi:choline dehydrogenase-like flavoprotein